MNLFRIVVLVCLIVPFVASAASARTDSMIVMDDCSSLSGTVECANVSWTYHERVLPNDEFYVTARVSSAASSIVTVFIDTNLTMVGGCTHTFVERFLSGDGAVESVVWRVSMNGVDTCSYHFEIGVSRSSGTDYQYFASGTTLSRTGAVEVQAETPFTLADLSNYTLFALILTFAAVVFLSRGWLPTGFGLVSAAAVSYVAGLGLDAAEDAFLFFLGIAIMIAIIEAMRFGLTGKSVDAE